MILLGPGPLTLAISRLSAVTSVVARFDAFLMRPVIQLIVQILFLFTGFNLNAFRGHGDDYVEQFVHQNYDLGLMQCQLQAVSRTVKDPGLEPL